MLAGDEVVILSMEKADGDFVVFYLLDGLNFFKIVFINKLSGDACSLLQKSGQMKIVTYKIL